MPKYRKLHTQITQSLDFHEMPDDFTRLVWVLLPLALDSEGRSVDNANLVLSRVMPMREDVSPLQIRGALDWFSERGMISRYVIGTRAYFYVPSWHRFQGDTSKEAESILPAPPEYYEDAQGYCESEQPEINEPSQELIEQQGQAAQELVESRARVSRESRKSKSRSDADADADIDTDSISPPPAAARPRSEKQLAQDAMIQALAEVCGRDWHLTSQIKLLSKYARELIAAQHKPDEIKRHFGRDGWWYREDWRGIRGQLPAPQQVSEMIVQAKSGVHVQREGYDGQLKAGKRDSSSSRSGPRKSDAGKDFAAGWDSP